MLMQNQSNKIFLLGGMGKKVVNEVLPIKCQVIRTRTNKRHERHIVNRLHGHTLAAVASGTISDDLIWHRHVDAVAAKASRTLGFMRRNLGQCTMETKSTAYTSLARPVLEYASPALDRPYQIRRHCQACESTKTGSSVCPRQLFREKS